ncbi:MAG: hypothetical protein ACYSO1_09330, partial [Planctomycetota bacterium]
MKKLSLLLILSVFVISGCQKDDIWYSVAFTNDSETIMYDGKVGGWQGVLGTSGNYGGLTLPVPDEI